MRPNILVGDVVRDTISGFEGVAVAKTQWLNGCVRITIQPRALHDGKPVDNYTFDVEQLELTSPRQRHSTESEPEPVMPSQTGGDRPSIGRNPDPGR